MITLHLQYNVKFHCMKKIQKILFLCTFVLSNVYSSMCFLKEKNTYQKSYKSLKDKLLFLFSCVANYRFNLLSFCNKINFLFTKKHLQQLSIGNFICEEIYSNYIKIRKNHHIIN